MGGMKVLVLGWKISSPLPFPDSSSELFDLYSIFLNKAHVNDFLIQISDVNT